MKTKVSAWQIVCRDRTMRMVLWIGIALVAAACVGPFFQNFHPDQITDQQLASPCRLHWMGTDVHGRDLQARLLEGLGISLLVGCIGALVSLVLGVTLGGWAGYAGGRTDNIIMRSVDVLYSLPRLVFVIVFMTALEKPVMDGLTRCHLPTWAPHVRLLLLFFGLGCVEWLTMARIVRGQVLVLRESAFVQAARALGQSPVRIFTRHLLPNLTGIVVVYLTLTIPVVILEESFLSFLGLGVQAPAASLGSLMADGAQALNPIYISWWLLVFPGMTMALLLLTLNFFGDGLRDALDPRKKAL